MHTIFTFVLVAFGFHAENRHDHDDDDDGGGGQGDEKPGLAVERLRLWVAEFEVALRRSCDLQRVALNTGGGWLSKREPFPVVSRARRLLREEKLNFLFLFWKNH